MYRTLIILGLAQCFGQTAQPVIVLLGGIIGAAIAPAPELATLPIALMIIGVAVTTIPASLLMARIGRKAGFLIATTYAILAGFIGAYAVSVDGFWLFCFSTFLIGSYAAFMQQFRFAVAESVPEHLIARCVSFLMLSGIVAALLGPEVAKRLSEVGDLPQFVGSFLGLSALMSVSFVILLFYRNADPVEIAHGDGARPLPEILRQPTLILAIAAAVVGWSIMSLIMTATPVSMHEMDHFSLEDTTWVIQSHILAMFVPSLFSGFLISWLGAERIIQAGLLLMFGCVLVGYGSPEFMHYWVSLVLLGVGWNFLFLGGTTLLTTTYRSSERFKVQAFNDFLVFALQAFASLGSGALLATFGWNGVIALSLPWLVILIPVLIVTRRGAVQTVRRVT